MVRRLLLLTFCAGLLSTYAADCAEQPPVASSQALAELRSWLKTPRAQRPELAKQTFAAVALNKPDAASAAKALWDDHAAFIQETRTAEMTAKVVELNGLSMRFDTVSFTVPGGPPAEGRSLFLSLHGGGNAAPRVNDGQWTNQVKLGNAYKPQEGLYLAPRAPTNTWNLWHEAHIDAFFDRLIENLIVLEKVNPNRIYVLGYSAGGDGVYQLAPRMADRFAAASMMAGHPNEASPLGLRNLPFSIQVGGNDAAYKRNTIAAEWGKQLDELQRADPVGYIHFTEVHAGKGHWMDMQDRKAIPWMEKYTRNPLPEKIVWRQDDVTHGRFYWLAVYKTQAAAGQELTALRKDQTITLHSKNVKTVSVLLNDAMLDLDKPVVIRAGETVLSEKRPNRTIGTLARTLAERGDPLLVFSAIETVTLP